MSLSGELSCEDIEALRYSILSADLSVLRKTDKQKIEEINTYLLEELTICKSKRDITFSDKELELLNSVIDKNYDIQTISDIKRIREEVQ
jgi:hypothetical protein